MEALKKWNADKPAWSMPKKGSSAYDEVRAMMAPIAAPAATAPPPPTPEPKKQRRPVVPMAVLPGPLVAAQRATVKAERSAAIASHPVPAATPPPIVVPSLENVTRGKPTPKKPAAK